MTGVVVTALYGNDGDLPLEGFAEAEEGVAHAVETVSGDDQPKFEKLRKLCRAAATGRLGGHGDGVSRISRGRPTGISTCSPARHQDVV